MKSLSCQFPYAGGVEADSPGSCEARTRGMGLFGIRTPAGCEDLGGCNPCRGRGFSSTPDPGLLRTPGYPLQRLRRTDGARLQLKAGCPHPAGQSAKFLWGRIPPDQHPAPALAAKRRTAIEGWSGAEPWVTPPMAPRLNGANGDPMHPVPCALSGHRQRCVARSPGLGAY